MNKKPGCTHQFDDEAKCAPALHLTYVCAECGTSWEDEWSCEVDGECPACGTKMTPKRSRQVAPCACEHLGKT